MFGHDGDLVAVHTKDFSLQVDQLSLTHLNIVTSLQVVFTLLTYSETQTQAHFACACCRKRLNR